MMRGREGFNNRCFCCVFEGRRELHLGMWYLWFIWVTPVLQCGVSSSPWLWPHCQCTCLLPYSLFWYWTHQTPFHVSSTYIHFLLSHTFSTFLSHRLMASQTRCLCPLSSFFIPPNFLTASLPLFLWLQPAELNIAAASLSKSADYIKSAFPLYPITDGSSKLIQDLSRTNVTPCFCLNQMGPRSALTDTAILNTWWNKMGFYHCLMFIK